MFRFLVAAVDPIKDCFGFARHRNTLASVYMDSTRFAREEMMMACKEDCRYISGLSVSGDIRSGHDGICAFWFLIGRRPRRVTTLGGIAERRSNLFCHHVFLQLRNLWCVLNRIRRDSKASRSGSNGLLRPIRSVYPIASQHRPGDAGEFVGQCHGRDIPPAIPFARWSI